MSALDRTPLPRADAAAVHTYTSRARQLLAAAANPAHAGPMAAYLKTTQPFYGVKKPALTAIFRELKQNPLPNADTAVEVALDLYRGSHREEQHLGIALLMFHKRWIHLDYLPIYVQMVRDGAWWDLVDPIAVHLIGAVWSAHPAAVTALAASWVTDADPWIRRTALIGVLRHKSATDTARLFAACRALAADRDWFVRKGMGWTLREYAKTNPVAVQDFLTAHWDELSGLTRTEAARHLRAAGWAPPAST